jgi:membrane protein required for colicin V production
MNFLDIILAIPIVLLGILGYRKGLIKEVASLVALILGIYLAIYFSDVVAKYLIEYFDISERYVFIIAFILTFIGVVILVSLLGKLLDKVASLAALGIINKFLGLVFGLLKGIILMSVLILLFNMIDRKANILKQETRDGSMLYAPISRVAPLIWMNIENIDFDDPSWDDYNKKVKDVSLDELVAA